VNESVGRVGTESVVLADTSCWIEYLHPNGSREVKSALRDAIAADRAAVCGPVVCEVLRGAGRADQTRIRRAMEGQVHLAQEDGDWLEVGRVLGELQQKGLQPPILDALISVIAARHAVVLWHFGDRHFGPIGRLLDLQLVDLKTVDS
jgi:predicted nucleic acid-binding protein